MASADIFLLCVCTWLVCCFQGIQGKLTCPVPVVNQTITILFNVSTADVASECSSSPPTTVQFEFIRKGATSGNPECAPAAYPPTAGTCDGTNTCGGCVNQGTGYYVYQYQFLVDDAREGGQITATTCPTSIKKCPVIEFVTPGANDETSDGCGSSCKIGLGVGIPAAVVVIGVIVGVVVCLKKKGTI